MFFRGDSKIHAKLFILIREILTLSLEKLVVRKAPVGGIVIILPFSAGDTAVDLGEWWGWFPQKQIITGNCLEWKHVEESRSLFLDSAISKDDSFFGEK